MIQQRACKSIQSSCREGAGREGTLGQNRILLIYPEESQKVSGMRGRIAEMRSEG